MTSGATKSFARLALSLARDSELRGARDGAERSRAAREAYDVQRAREREVLGAIGEFSDPRRAVSTLSDSAPILLFPVRLESRFKQVTDEAGSERHELWIYRSIPTISWSIPSKWFRRIPRSAQPRSIGRTSASRRRSGWRKVGLETACRVFRARARGMARA